MRRSLFCFAACKLYILLAFFLHFFTIPAFTQVTVTGIVTGKDNLPLESATVSIKGNNSRILTSADGSYAINAKKGDIMLISFVGYKSRQIEKGNISEANAILSDIKENEQKINHHGKRADAIVKSMLQHSRSGSGEKKTTNINTLADEYLRLAYHGLRAKDKLFNAILKTDFDDSIGNINIVPQDIGMVLLNLYNNAFYAVAERNNQPPGDYQPAVSVSTKKNGAKVEISVRDNGNGIPQKIVDKIFNPSLLPNQRARERD